MAKGEDDDERLVIMDEEAVELDGDEVSDISNLSEMRLSSSPVSLTFVSLRPSPSHPVSVPPLVPDHASGSSESEESDAFLYLPLYDSCGSTETKEQDDMLAALEGMDLTFLPHGLSRKEYAPRSSSPSQSHPHRSASPRRYPASRWSPSSPCFATSTSLNRIDDSPQPQRDSPPIDSRQRDKDHARRRKSRDRARDERARWRMVTEVGRVEDDGILGGF